MEHNVDSLVKTPRGVAGAISAATGCGVWAPAATTGSVLVVRGRNGWGGFYGKINVVCTFFGSPAGYRHSVKLLQIQTARPESTRCTLNRTSLEPLCPEEVLQLVFPRLSWQGTCRR